MSTLDKIISDIILEVSGPIGIPTVSFLWTARILTSSLLYHFALSLILSLASCFPTSAQGIECEYILG